MNKTDALQSELCNYLFLWHDNSILLPIFDDEKEKRYAERDSGRDEKDQGSGVASEGFFQR